MEGALGVEPLLRNLGIESNGEHLDVDSSGDPLFGRSFFCCMSFPFKCPGRFTSASPSEESSESSESDKERADACEAFLLDSGMGDLAWFEEDECKSMLGEVESSPEGSANAFGIDMLDKIEGMESALTAPPLTTCFEEEEESSELMGTGRISSSSLLLSLL